MNAPLARPAASASRGSEIVPLSDWIANPDPAWSAVAARASEPNSFLEPWFLTASAHHLDVPPDARILTVREEGQLIGLMPIFTAPNYGRLPVANTQNWLHYNSFFGAPLVRRSFEPFFWSRALALLDAEMSAPALFHVVGLDAEGPLVAALFCARAGTAIVHRIKRALLASDLSPAAYYEAAVRKKKRKEIGRLQSRLAELGPVEYSRLAGRQQLDEWIDTFLALEASGWKGGDGGAALGNDASTAAFLREALHGAFNADRLEIIRLDVGGRTIAMLINFLAPPGSYSFKIAFDEEYGRYSPGVLIQIENYKVLERAGIRWMDSCAVEGHPMIESLWRERREIVRVTVPLKGWKRRATFMACRALETLSAGVRKVRA